MKRTLQEWDLFQLCLARQYSTMSRDVSTKVGAIVCDRDSKYVYGAGYNGLPAHMEDTPEHLNDREFKLRHTIHAEINALTRFEDNQQYWHRDVTTLVVYPFIPCSHCAKYIVHDSPIKRVVTLDYVPERWREDFLKSEEILRVAGIEISRYKPAALGFEEGDRL